MNNHTSAGMSSGRSRSGGNLIGKDAQAVIQVRPESSLGDRGLEIDVRRRDQPHVDAAGLGRADALELAFLQDAQQLGLQLGRELADLVEKNRAAVGQLEPPLPHRPRRR